MFHGRAVRFQTTFRPLRRRLGRKCVLRTPGAQPQVKIRISVSTLKIRQKFPFHQVVISTACFPKAHSNLHCFFGDLQIFRTCWSVGFRLHLRRNSVDDSGPNSRWRATRPWMYAYLCLYPISCVFVSQVLAFERWLLENGGRYSRLEIRRYDTEVRGVHAKEDIDPDEVIVEIPLK